MPETQKISDSDVRARAFWSGTITFGLVSIPVNLFPATRSSRVRLRMVDPEGTSAVREGTSVRSTSRNSSRTRSCAAMRPKTAAT